jgi:hypothetical protein
MATTRQLRGGDYVLRVGEEDLDILCQGIQKLQDSPPDFAKVEPAFRETMEHTYFLWRKRADKLADLIACATKEEVEDDEDQHEADAVPAQRGSRG